MRNNYQERKKATDEDKSDGYSPKQEFPITPLDFPKFAVTPLDFPTPEDFPQNKKIKKDNK